MTPQQRTIVLTNLLKVAPIADTAATPCDPQD